ncbi:hypothetical protein ACLVWQ_24895 [Streptomyces sp. CWNU-52B]|uniref:hypothetical protein n=1 Tax=unclassified Streptomyces TaxID=2593676 RepID=UPI0039C426C1
MGTKTENEAGIETGTEARRDEENDEKGAAGKAGEAGEIGEVEAAGEAADAGAADDRSASGSASDSVSGSEDLDEEENDGEDAHGVAATAGAGSGVAMGAAAVVSAGLGIVSLTGSWIGTVAQARDSLYGQLETAQGSPVATQIKQVYADSWNANALVAGFFALAALIVGVVVLVRPAFGNPDRIPAQFPWVKSVAWAGVALGVIGLLLAALKYSDVLLGMPTTS